MISNLCEEKKNAANDELDLDRQQMELDAKRLQLRDKRRQKALPPAASSFSSGMAPPTRPAAASLSNGLSSLSIEVEEPDA